MCRLFGYIDKKMNQKQRLNLTNIMGWKSECQGPHSWGLYTLSDKNVESFDKGLGAFKGYLHSKKSNEIKQDIRSAKIVLGHTRQATHGDVKIKNCHPFEQGELILAHNGVITGHDRYKRETTIMPKGETDSETVLCWLVSQGKRVVDLLDVDSHYDSFEVYNRRSKIVYLVCKGRELYVASTDKGVFWSSEHVILETSYQATFGVKPKIQKIEDGVFAVTQTGVTAIKKAKIEPVAYQTTYQNTWERPDYALPKARQKHWWDYGKFEDPKEEKNEFVSANPNDEDEYADDVQPVDEFIKGGK